MIVVTPNCVDTVRLELVTAASACVALGIAAASVDTASTAGTGWYLTVDGRSAAA